MKLKQKQQKQQAAPKQPKHRHTKETREAHKKENLRRYAEQANKAHARHGEARKERRVEAQKDHEVVTAMLARMEEQVDEERRVRHNETLRVWRYADNVGLNPRRAYEVLKGHVDPGVAIEEKVQAQLGRELKVQLVRFKDGVYTIRTLTLDGALLKQKVYLKMLGSWEKGFKQRIQGVQGAQRYFEGLRA